MKRLEHECPLCGADTFFPYTDCHPDDYDPWHCRTCGYIADPADADGATGQGVSDARVSGSASVSVRAQNERHPL